MNATALIAKMIKATQKSLYTYPGGTIAPIYHECSRSGVEIICSKAEQGAGYMALADAILSGSPSFVAVTSGPGVTNLITCVADAFYDSVPLLVFTGQVGTADLDRSKLLRQRGFQEVPTIELMRPITKKTYQPRTVDGLADVLCEGYKLANSGRPGPVLIDLPMNVQLTEITQEIVDDFDHTQFAKGAVKKLPKHVDEKVLESVTHSLQHSAKPLILVGWGARDSYQYVRTLAEKFSIPVISSLRGIGIMPSLHPMYFGWIGHTGFPWANAILHQADCILVLGSRLDVRQTGSVLNNFQEKKIIHIDIDENELSFGRLKPEVVHTEVGTFLERFTPFLEAQSYKGNKAWIDQCVNMKETYALEDYGKRDGVRPDDLLKYIDKISRNLKSAVVTGVGSHQQWAARYFSFDMPRNLFFTSAGHGTMGYGLPVALGIKRLEPDRLVICVDGDGSLQMNLQELALIAEYDLAIKIVVMDNSRLGIVSQFQQITFGDDPVTGNFKNPDFSSLAEVYGIRAWRLNSLQPGIVDQWLNHDGPALLHVNVQCDAPVSPMLLGGQSLNDMWRYHG
jgi:acetolactate synthase I/II/III large subunit